MRALATLFALFASTSSVHAADWFDRVSERLGTIEVLDGGQILLWVNTGGGAPITVQGRTSTCSMTSLLLTPTPASAAKDWLAMVLAATMSGNAFTVFGNCNASTQQLEATKLQVVYQGT
jgi:hypothetical protein